MNPNHILSHCVIQDGDIICFQIYISDQEVHNLESLGLYSNPIQFYNFLQNQVTEPNTREEFSPDASSLGAVPEVEIQQQQQQPGNIPPQATSFFRLLQDSGREIESRVNEMDEVGSPKLHPPP